MLLAGQNSDYPLSSVATAVASTGSRAVASAGCSGPSDEALVAMARKLLSSMLPDAAASAAAWLMMGSSVGQGWLAWV